MRVTYLDDGWGICAGHSGFLRGDDGVEQLYEAVEFQADIPVAMHLHDGVDEDCI